MDYDHVKKQLGYGIQTESKDNAIKAIEQLTARVRELEEENARLRFALADTEALELGTSERLATLTRQRDNLLAQVDLAVEALEKYATSNVRLCNLWAVEALSAIKESEGK